jgi:hypothetical protein
VIDIDQAAPTSIPLIALIDLLNCIAQELDEAESIRAEREEMIAAGLGGIDGNLAIELHAECAARSIDWFDLLAAATRKCVAPRQMN